MPQVFWTILSRVYTYHNCDQLDSAYLRQDQSSGKGKGSEGAARTNRLYIEDAYPGKIPKGAEHRKGQGRYLASDLGAGFKGGPKENFGGSMRRC